jgi:hypothetical protein
VPKPRPSKSDALEARLTAGGRTAQRMVEQTQLLMRSRAVFHAELSPGVMQGSANADYRIFNSLFRITDTRAVFKRCRELAEKGFIEWVIRVKKLLFNDGLKITGLADDGAKAELERILRDACAEYLICNSVIGAWKAADGEALPVVQVVDCEGVKYENDFGEETLRICYKSRPMSAEQKEKLGGRYVKALMKGEEIVWGEEAGEDFTVLTGAKLGNGLGRPSLWAVFEDLALHGLLVKGDYNAAWTVKDVIRQFKKGHDIKAGNMAGMPVHFLKASERDAIHKAVADKVGAFDIVTNFDIDVEYPAFDFGFFKQEKYAGVRQRLLEWAGPVGTMYLGERSQDPETIMALLRAECFAARADLARFAGQLRDKPGFAALRGAKPEWNFLTMASLQETISFVNAATGLAAMSTITAREVLGLEEERENARMDEQLKKPQHYRPIFEPHQAMLTNPAPTPEGGRPPAPNP